MFVLENKQNKQIKNTKKNTSLDEKKINYAIPTKIKDLSITARNKIGKTMYCVRDCTCSSAFA